MELETGRLGEWGGEVRVVCAYTRCEVLGGHGGSEKLAQTCDVKAGSAKGQKEWSELEGGG